MKWENCLFFKIVALFILFGLSPYNFLFNIIFDWLELPNNRNNENLFHEILENEYKLNEYIFSGLHWFHVCQDDKSDSYLTHSSVSSSVAIWCDELLHSRAAPVDGRSRTRRLLRYLLTFHQTAAMGFGPDLVNWLEFVPQDRHASSMLSEVKKHCGRGLPLPAVGLGQRNLLCPFGILFNSCPIGRLMSLRTQSLLSISICK